MGIPDLVKALLVTLALAVIFAPMILLFLSAIKFKRVAGGVSSWLILTAGILLALLSLRGFYSLFLTAALKMNAEELAEASLVLFYTSAVAEYLAFLLFGIGMWMQAKRIQGILASKEKAERSSAACESLD